jgi:hypothetical protein
MHSRQQPEMSQLQRQLLGQEHVKFYTQAEFDEALAFAKAEIMTVAIETTKRAIMIEREACAQLADECVNIEELGEAIRNRIPSQRQ